MTHRDDHQTETAIRVRVLTAGDAAAFQAVRLAGLRECPSAFLASYEEEVDATPAAIAARLEPQPDRAVLGAFDADALVGILGVHREAPRKLVHKAYIWGVYVVPAQRGAGVGVMLMTEALAFARSVLRVRQVNLSVNAANGAAKALYERMGFRQYGLEHGFMLQDGELQDEIFMACVVDGVP